MLVTLFLKYYVSYHTILINSIIVLLLKRPVITRPQILYYANNHGVNYLYLSLAINMMEDFKQPQKDFQTITTAPPAGEKG